MKRAVLVLICVMICLAVMPALSACNETATVDTELYEIAVEFMLSVFSQYPRVDVGDVDDGVFEISFSVSPIGGDEKGHVIVDAETGEVLDLYLDSGNPPSSILIRKDAFNYDAAAAAKKKAEYETGDPGLHVLMGFKEPIVSNDFLNSYYVELYSKLLFAAVGGAVTGDYLSGYQMPAEGPDIGANVLVAASIGMNPDRLTIHDPYPGNPLTICMPLLRYEEIMWRFGIYHDDALKHYADTFLHALGGENMGVVHGDGVYATRRPVYGFYISCGEAYILQMLEEDDNLYIVDFETEGK